MFLRNFFFIFCTAIIVTFGGCKTKNEKIPAYLQIDSVQLKCLSGQGNRVNALNAYQISVDGDFLGIFELPLKIPVLYSGKHKVSLIALYQPSASALHWAIYSPVYSADTTMNFTPAKVSTFNNGVFKFRPVAVFPWTEDFEDANSSIIFDTAFSVHDTLSIVTTNFDLKGRFSGFTKALQLDLKSSDTIKNVMLKSFNSFSTLPNDGTDIYFEFDMKSPIAVEFALYRNNVALGFTEYVPFLTMYSTGTSWKHFMVNLQAEIAGQAAGNKYTLLFRIQKPAEYTTDVKILLDNLRLVYLP